MTPQHLPDSQPTAMQLVTPLARSSAARAVWEFLLTLALVVGTWTLCALGLVPAALERGGWWLGVLIAGELILALWLVRLFVVQHDAGHGALSPSPVLNRVIGHLCSVFVFTPYVHWARNHWRHHCTAGNIEEQDGLGDVYTMTVRQYRALPAWKRFGYRLIRNPIHFLLIAPANLFFVFHRWPMIHFPFCPVTRWPSAVEWLDVLALDAVYVAVGWWAWTNWAVAAPWVLTFLGAFIVAATVGMTLFYTQHQFEGTYYRHETEWDFHDSSMKGSMTLRLPAVWMEWCIGFINYHALHHLKPTMPMYHLRAAYVKLRENGYTMPECGVGDIWGTFHLALWDEDRQRLISFAEADRL